MAAALGTLGDGSPGGLSTGGEGAAPPCTPHHWHLQSEAAAAAPQGSAGRERALLRCLPRRRRLHRGRCRCCWKSLRRGAQQQRWGQPSQQPWQRRFRTGCEAAAAAAAPTRRAQQQQQRAQQRMKTDLPPLAAAAQRTSLPRTGLLRQLRGQSTGQQGLRQLQGQSRQPTGQQGLRRLRDDSQGRMGLSQQRRVQRLWALVRRGPPRQLQQKQRVVVL